MPVARGERNQDGRSNMLTFGAQMQAQVQGAIARDIFSEWRQVGRVAGDCTLDKLLVATKLHQDLLGGIIGQIQAKQDQ